MKTRHENITDHQFVNIIKCALHEVNSYCDNLRIVNCGRGVVILPDTNRKADCTERELIKALGLVKKCDGLHLEETSTGNTAERKPVMLRRSDDTPEWLSLTPDQWRLLTWLSRNNFFWDEMEIQEIQPTGFKEI